MIVGLRWISFRHFASYKIRTLFTIAGVALGVAAIIGIRLVNEGASSSFRRSLEHIAGKAALQVTNGEAGVPEELLDEINGVPGVGAAAGSVYGFVPAADLRGERLFILGIDLLVDQKLREYDFGVTKFTADDELIFVSKADSVALTTEFLDRYGLKVGDRISVRAPSGPASLTIRATIETSRGPATLFSGRLALMSFLAAQRLFNLDRRFTQIDVGLADGVDLSAVQPAVVRTVAGRGRVERPTTRGESLDRLLAGDRYIFTVGAMLAVLIGLYLIFNTMMMAVVQRRREIGILRSLGAGRSSVIGLIFLEAAALGALGALLGVPLGAAFARLISTPFSENVSSRFVAIEVGKLTLEPIAVLWGVAIGIISALVAAVLPAIEAVRVHPIEALRPPVRSGEQSQSYRRAALVGGALLVGGAIAWLYRHALPIEIVRGSGAWGYAGFLIAVSLMGPAALRALAKVSEPLLQSTLGPIGSLASRNIVAGLRRVAITSAALVISLAGAIALATLISSLDRTLHVWLDTNYSKLDIGIRSSASFSVSSGMPLPGKLVEELATLPEVSGVNAERWVKIPFEASITHLIARDTDTYRHGLKGLDLVSGDPGESLEEFSRGEAVIVGEVFAHRFGKGLGDVVTLSSPSGEVHLRIAAVCFDVDELGTVVIDRAAYRRLWRDDTVSFVNLALRATSDRDRVAETIRGRWGEEYGLSVLTMDQFRGEAESMLSQAIFAAYPLITLAIAIALLGVVTALLTSVFDRMREIGVLRAIGATRRQVARLIMTEAAIIGFSGGAFGVAAGSLLGYRDVDTSLRAGLGLTVLYSYPAAAAIFAFFAAVALTVAAGWAPARKASGVKITAALGYE